MENSNNLFNNTPDSVFSYLAQTYNQPGNTGNFRAQQAASGQSDYGASPLFTQAQIEAGRTSGHLGTKLFLQKYSPSITIGTDRRIKVNAPQSFFDSTYYKEQVKPKLDSYVGRNVTDQAAMADLQADLQTTWNAAVNDWSSKMTAQNYFGQMSDDELNKITQLSTAQSVTGDPSQWGDVTVPIKLTTESPQYSGDWLDLAIDGQDGRWSSSNSDESSTMQEMINVFQNWNDRTKETFLGTLDDTINSSKRSPYQRARASYLKSILQSVAEQNEDYSDILTASHGTAAANAIVNWMQGAPIISTASGILTGGELAKVQPINSQYLSGATRYDWIPSLTNTVGNFMVAGAIGGAASNAANKLTGVAKAVQTGAPVSKTANYIATAFGGGIGGGRVAQLWRAADPIGSVSFGLGNAWLNKAAGYDDEYTGQDFLMDMAFGAGAYAGLRGLSKVGKFVGDTRPGKFINRNVNRAIYKASGTKLGHKLSTITSTPQEAKKIRKARLADAQESKDYLRRRKAARKAGEAFTEKERVNANLVNAVQDIAAQRQANARREFATNKKARIAEKLASKAGIDLDEATKRVEDFIAENIGTDEDAVFKALYQSGTDSQAADDIMSVEQALQEAEQEAGQATTAVDTAEPNLKAQDPDVDSTKLKDTKTTNGLDQHTAQEQAEIEVNNLRVQESNNPAAFGERGENLTRWLNDVNNLDQYIAIRDLDDITKKLNRGQALTPQETALLNRYRDSQSAVQALNRSGRNRPNFTGNPPELTIEQREDLDFAIRKLVGRIKDNPISKDSEALAIARERYNTLAKLHAKIQDYKAEMGLYDMRTHNPEVGKALLNAHRLDPRYRNYMTQVPIGATSDLITARGGNKTSYFTDRIYRQYLDPLSAAQREMNGIRDNVYQMRQKQIASDFDGSGGATVEMSRQQIIEMDNRFSEMSDELRGILKDGGYDASDVEKMFAYERVESPAELISRAEQATKGEEAQAAMRTGTALGRDMSRTLDPQSVASRAKATNPNAFVQVEAPELNTKTVSDYDARLNQAANNPNLSAKMAYNINVVDMENQAGTKFVGDLIDRIPADTLNRLSTRDKEIVNNFKFGRDGSSVRDVVGIPRIATYLEMQGIHGIYSPTEGFIQVSPTARIYNTSTSKQAIFDRMNNNSAGGKENVENSIHDAVDSLFENYKFTIYGDDAQYQAILKIAHANGVSPDTVLAQQLARDGKTKRSFADAIYDNSEMGGIGKKRNTQALVGSTNPDLMPDGWKPGDRLLTKDDFLRQCRTNKDGTLNKQDVKKWTKKWEKFDELCSMEGYANTAEEIVSVWTKDDFRKAVDDYVMEMADNSSAYDHMTPDKRRDIQEVSAAESDIESTIQQAKTPQTAPAAETIDSQETLDSVNPTGSVSADYTPEKRATAPLGENITTLAETAGKSPSDTITIYRGVPKGVNEIVAGDFVTTNKQLAQDYAGDGNVISLEVTYGDILDDRTEPLGEEYIYRPGSSADNQTPLPDTTQATEQPTTQTEPTATEQTPEQSTNTQTEPTTEPTAKTQTVNKTGPDIKPNDSTKESITSASSNGGLQSTISGDKTTARGIKADQGGSPRAGGFTRFFAVTNRFFKTLTTTINPNTWMRNIFKDMGLSWYTAGTDMFDILSANVDNPIGFIKNNAGIYNSLVQTMGSAEAVDDYLLRVFTEMKGPMGGITEVAYYRGDPSDIRTKAGRRLDKVANFLETPSAVIEQRIRQTNGLTTFTRLLEEGYDPEYAAQRAIATARLATTDFSMGLNKLNGIRTFSTYAAAAVNGTRSFWRMATLDPAGLSFRVATGLLLPVAYLTWSALDDPNKRPIYESIKEEDKEKNAIFVGQDGTVVYLPLTDEVLGLYNIARKFSEKIHGDLPEGYGHILLDGLLQQSPIDIDWIADVSPTDEFGQPQNVLEQVWNGALRTASQFAPAVVGPLYSVATGRSMYYGDEIQNYSDMDSPTYNAIANWLGLPVDNTDDKSKTIGQIKNFITGWFGTTTNYLIYAADRLMGAPEEKAGGKSLLDSIAKTFTGDQTYTDADNKFYDAIDSAEKQKEQLKKKLSDLDYQANNASDEKKAELQQKRQELIDEYTNTISEIFTKYGQMYEYTGGITQERKKKIIKLLNLGTEESTGRGEFGSLAAEQMSDAQRQEYYDALQRYEQTGLEDPTGPIMPYRTSSGEWKTTAPSVAIQNAINRSYGAPEEMAYEVKQAISTEHDGINLWDIRNDYKQQISALYDQAEAQGTDPDYDAIADLQYEFLKEFDNYMKPVIDKYGEFIMNNYEVVDELRGLLSGMIPTETYQKDKYGRFRSMPLMEVDLQEWLQKHYGIGQGNLSGMPSSEEVSDAVNRINEAVRNGQLAQAKALAQRINNRIGRGEIYASGSDMDVISNVLGY